MWKILIFATISALVEYYAERYRKVDLRETFVVNSSNYYLPHVESFDFIVVGAGAAGCVLASRLSENSSIKVLLLEFGGNPPPQTEIPAYTVLSSAYGTSNIIFDYLSVPQKHANNKTIRSMQGKVMGGGSTVNGMVFNRGNPKDFDNWALITGDNSWRYKNVLRHFKDIEDYQGEFPLGTEHGEEGLMTVSKQDFAPGRTEWLAAGREKGYQVRDSNGPQMPGFAPYEYNKKNGRRHSSYLAYIKPFESERPNLKIMRYAEVTEILFDDNGKAFGVMYKKHGTFGAAFANKEIIVSAGAYGSSLLLMRSGIGPAEVLEKANIQPRVNLPVGKNYKDHQVLTMEFFTQDKSIILDPETDYNQTVVDDFERNGTGPLTASFQGLTGQALLVSSVAVSENQSDWPDYQFTLTSVSFSPPKNASDVGYSMNHGIVLTRPKSKGHVAINPNDTTGPPIMDLNFLHDKRDVKVFMDAIKMSLDIFEKTNVYKKKKVKYTNIPVPACQHLPFRSDPYWECYIRNGVFSGLHPTGTCPMGRSQSDPKAVVDSKLRVFGVTGLRVVDASIMPEIVNCHPQAAILMIAEKISSEIKTVWGI